MPFCAHPLRVLPDHLAGRAADGHPDDDAVAGDPASQMVGQGEGPVHSVCFLSDKAHLLVCWVAGAGCPGPALPRSPGSRSVRDAPLL